MSNCKCKDLISSDGSIIISDVNCKHDVSINPSFFNSLNLNLNVCSPLTYDAQTTSLCIVKSGQSNNGYLSSTDWNLFNNKVSDGLNICESGYSIFDQKNGTVLQFKGIIAGQNVEIEDNGSCLTINVPNADSFTVSTQDTEAIDLSGNGSVGDPLTATLLLSADSGNIAEIRADGLYVPPDENFQSEDGLSIDFSGSGTSIDPLTAEVIYDNTGNVQFSITADGLRGDVNISTESNSCVTLSGVGNPLSPITADLVISSDPDNLLECTPDGLFVSSTPPAPVYTVDNGLHANTSTNFRLGGLLVENTEINTDSLYPFKVLDTTGTGFGIRITDDGYIDVLDNTTYLRWNSTPIFGEYNSSTNLFAGKGAGTTLGGSEVTAFGYNALNVATAIGNTAIGYRALEAGGGNGGNVAIGSLAAKALAYTIFGGVGVNGVYIG